MYITTQYPEANLRGHELLLSRRRKRRRRRRRRRRKTVQDEHVETERLLPL
jgi:hypothetical protein